MFAIPVPIFYPYLALLPSSFRFKCKINKKTYQRLETCHISSLCPRCFDMLRRPKKNEYNYKIIKHTSSSRHVTSQAAAMAPTKTAILCVVDKVGRYFDKHWVGQSPERESQVHNWVLRLRQKASESREKERA